MFLYVSDVSWNIAVITSGFAVGLGLASVLGMLCFKNVRLILTCLTSLKFHWSHESKIFQILRSDLHPLNPCWTSLEANKCHSATVHLAAGSFIFRRLCSPIKTQDLIWCSGSCCDPCVVGFACRFFMAWCSFVCLLYDVLCSAFGVEIGILYSVRFFFRSFGACLRHSDYWHLDLVVNPLSATNLQFFMFFVAYICNIIGFLVGTKMTLSSKSPFSWSLGCIRVHQPKIKIFKEVYQKLSKCVSESEWSQISWKLHRKLSPFSVKMLVMHRWFRPRLSW